MDNNDELVAEARLWFLNGLKAYYWEQLESGFLEREGIAILMATADDAQDHGRGCFITSEGVTRADGCCCIACGGLTRRLNVCSCLGSSSAIE